MSTSSSPRPSGRVVAALVLALVAPPVLGAQSSLDKLLPPLPAPHAYTGEVALGARVLAVGAPGFRGLGGAVFVYDRGTTSWIGTIVPSDASAPATNFGFALDLDGRTLAIGAPGQDGHGRAALHDAHTGRVLRPLLPAAPVAGSRFGASIALGAEVVAVGAPGSFFPASPDDGVVHLFERATGQPLAAIPSPDPDPIFDGVNQFGAEVALDGGHLLASAPQGLGGVGAVYVFDVATATRQHRLEPPAGSAASTFGWSIAASDGRAAVSDPNAAGTGAVYLYDLASGAHLLTVWSTEPADVFGASLALDAERLVVGATGEKTGAAQGAVRVFDVVTGAPREVLVGFPAATTHVFGASVDLADGELAIGDPQDGELAQYAGAAYLLRADG